MAERSRFFEGRHAGLLVPLFSIPSQRSWGIGEIADLPRLAAWMRSAALDFVQLLPVNEMEQNQSSPYSAMSAMAIDPIFIAIADVPELREEDGGTAVVDGQRLAAARSSSFVDYRAVRTLKAEALAAAYARFRERQDGSGSDRERAFQAFQERQRWWLDDYALFRALHDEHGGVYWREWPAALRDRDPGALAEASARLRDRVRYHQYVQWLADDQWRDARQACGGVGLFGDFPFMVSGHSADVWARQHEFHLDGSVGVPPDPFDPEGQDWGLPAYRWDLMERNGYEWLRQRIVRSVELYDGMRIDHLVGFYRTFIRERSGARYFSPAEEWAQLAQGERLMGLFLESGLRLMAEDLGVVPDFVRESLGRLQLPGLKVLRWERKWHDPGQPFRAPAEYPRESTAITSTHDTETLAEWWDKASDEERRLCAEAPGLRDAGCDPAAGFTPAVRDALLRAIFTSGSSLVIVPLQDLFGWRDRINIPGTVDDRNWTWRLPWPVDAMPSQAAAVERAAFLAGLARDTGRA